MKKTKKKKKKAFKLERRKSYNSIYEQIVKIGLIVADILKKDLPSRDDDNILLIRFWKRKGMKESWSVKKFKYRFIIGKLGLVESVMRCRRLLQSKHPELRGQLYEQRHQAEELMKNQLKLF